MSYSQSIVSSAFCVALSVTHYPAFAQPPVGGPGVGADTVITKAATILDTDPPQIEIYGDNFGNDPDVFLGDEFGGITPICGPTAMLPCTLATDSKIVADLPTVDPGSYMLIVEAGTGAAFTGIIDIAIGQVGPPGLPGMDGMDGMDGSDGLDGLDGLACWDLNASGSCDSLPGSEMNEDKNLDGSCTAVDCQGSAVLLTRAREMETKKTTANSDLLSVACEDGYVVSGGGFNVSSGFDVTESEPTPDGQGWFIKGFNTCAPCQLSLTAWANCLKVEPASLGTQKIIETKKTTASQDQITASCDPGYVVSGGGFNVSSGFAVTESEPSANGEGWFMKGFNTCAPCQLSLSAWAVCVKFIP